MPDDGSSYALVWRTRGIGYTQVGTADGYFGQNTETAVKAFQKDKGLTVDGIFGKNSKQKLWDLIDRRG